MRQREIKIFDITIGSVGEVRRLFATNLPGVPVRVTSRPQCFTMAAGDATIRRGTVLLYNRERGFWVQYRTIYDALAGIRHAQRGYGMSGDFPRTELARLDSMLLNLEGAREIMLGYRTMTEEQRNRAALRLVQAADEYRMPRVEKKVRARAWLARAALQMLPADEPHPGSGHGRNPGAALATSLPARDALRGRKGDIRDEISPRLLARDRALLRELDFCLALFGRLAIVLDELRESPVFALTEPDDILGEDIKTSCEQPLREWHRVMYALADIGHKLDEQVLPAPFCRYAKRIANELRRAAYELESRNFPVSADLIDRAVHSLDFLSMTERLFEFKEELAVMQVAPIAANSDRLMEMCVTLYGMACLLNGEGFSRDTSARVRMHLQSAVTQASVQQMHSVRSFWDTAEHLLGG